LGEGVTRKMLKALPDWEGPPSPFPLPRHAEGVPTARRGERVFPQPAKADGTGTNNENMPAAKNLIVDSCNDVVAAPHNPLTLGWNRRITFEIAQYFPL